MDPIELSEDTPIVVATDNGELLWVTEDGNDRAEIAADGAEIVVVETDDGQQQIQLVTEDGGQLLTLPPELASRLKANLSDLVAGDGVQQLLVTQDEYDDGVVGLQEGAVELQEGAVELQEGAVELHEGDVELQDGAVELQEGAVEPHEGAVELQKGDVELQEGVVELQDGTVVLQEGAVELQDGTVELQDGAVELQDGAVGLQDGAVELQGEGIELQEGAIELQEGVVLNEGADELQGAVVLEEGTVVLEEGGALEEGAVVLQDEDKFDEAGTEVLALEEEQPDNDMTEAAKVISDSLVADVGADPQLVSQMGDDSQLVPPEVSADSLTSDGANCTPGEVGTERSDEIEDGHVMNDQMVNFMEVEEESGTSDVENLAEEYVDEEIGGFLGDLGFTGPIDGLKMNQTQSVSMAAAAGTPKNDAAQWTESTVTSASGAQLKIRLPIAASLGGVATPQPPQPTFRVVRPLTTTGPPIQPPQPLYKKKKTSADVDAWAARTRRRASHGIARAVAAVRRAEDSDSFDSDDDEEESTVPAPAPPPGQPKRGRGRPRKPGGFSCQLCSRRLETQAQFFQHLRDHYEKPEGEEGETPAAEDVAGVSERLEPIPEHGGDGDGPSVLNVDIIASETVKIECEHCDLTFFSEEDFERHTKTHIQEALDAAEESSESESEQETVADDLGDGHAGDAVQLAHPGGDLELPSAPDVDPAAADRYEMKNLKKCDDCPKLFTTLSSLRNHRQRMHNMNGAPVSTTNAAKLEYECEECHVTYTSQKIHERHKRLHENKAAGLLPHRCTACGVSFLTSMLLAHHAQKEHPETCQRRKRQGDGPLRPNGRPPGSSNKDRQAVYDQIRELESGMFSCIICGKEAKTKNQMFYHVSIKHKALEGHKCQTCEKAFFTETALRVHERTHTGERPFVCDYCSRRFRQQADLNSHVMSLHTMERPYRCRFCAKAFARKYSLTIHMRCHTNERNYRCPVCNKGFRASTYLTGHMKIHTGEKAHACPICHKTFRMRSDMKRHIFTHSRDRPHPRSLRSLTVQVAGGQTDEEVMLLDPNQLCLQLLTGEDGESMVITEGGQTMVLDGSQTVIDQQTGQVMVPESAISELDETAMASMYLMADGQTDAMELT